LDILKVFIFHHLIHVGKKVIVISKRGPIFYFRPGLSKSQDRPWVDAARGEVRGLHAKLRDMDNA
jgi:hypothetical protein